MAALGLLYEREIPINEHIKVVVPTVGEIMVDEGGYYNLVSIMTAAPIDYMVQLDDAGIDFSEINDYELFLLMFGGIKSQDTSLIFGDLDLSNFDIDVNEQNENIILKDKKSGVVIDRSIHWQIAETLRKIHHLKRDRRKPGNEEAKKYMIKRAREKMNRRKNKPQESQLEPLIVAMVNKEQFKYNYESVLDISIYQFNESVHQIINVVDYEHKMSGVYAGTVDPKNMSRDEFNWLVHK